MTFECTRAILRILGLTTMLIGLVTTTITVIGIVGLGGSPAALYVIAAHASIILWGYMFFAVSPRLAGITVGSTTPTRRQSAPGTRA